MLAIHDTAYKMHILSIDRDGNRTSYTNGNINTISDIEMVNGKLYAVKYKEKKLVEITMENGAFSEKTLATLPYSVTALTVADDGSTFYVAESLDIDNKYRISRVSIDSTGNVSTAVVLERFETTGTKLSRDQTVAIYIQGQYIMKDYQYFPVETYSVPLQGCYGLALDDQGHLIVAESFSSLILKVFNPHL